MMQRSGNAQTTTLLGLIVIVLLTLVIGALAYTKYNEAQMLRAGNREVDPASVERSLQSRLKEIAELEDSIAAAERQIDRQQRHLHNLDLYLAGRGAAYDEDTGSWLIGDPEKERTRRQMMTSNVATSLSLLESRARELENQDPIFRPMERAIDDFQNATNRVLQDITNMDAKLEEDKEALTQRFEEMQDKRKADNKAYQNSISVTDTAISQSDDEIRKLLELQLRWLTELKPDGRVLNITEDRRLLIIDIGSQDRVMNGLKFDIFQYVHGGFIRKGMCEVINTENQISTCRVTEEMDPRRNPIAKDDMIGNPVFNIERPMTFVLAGEFVQFNRSDLQTFIEKSGSRVRPELGPGVDFLVAGKRSDSAQDKAREFQILAMTEQQLVRYLNTTFRTLE